MMTVSHPPRKGNELYKAPRASSNNHQAAVMYDRTETHSATKTDTHSIPELIPELTGLQITPGKIRAFVNILVLNKMKMNRFIGDAASSNEQCGWIVALAK